MVYKEKGNFEDLRKGGLTKGNCNRYVGSKVIGPNAWRLQKQDLCNINLKWLSAL